MPSPRFKNVTLFVLALDGKDVREIDENGKPLMDLRVVGKRNGKVLPDGVQIPYHSHYIARLKEGMLLPLDLATAQHAGVAWNPVTSDVVTKTKPTIKSTQ
jgi:hypothetical protein